MDNPSTIVLRSQLWSLGVYVAPRTPTEQKLAQIWRDGLGMDQVGIADRYDDLGIDSFLAASIFAELEKTFNIELRVASILEAPTIEQMAARIDHLVSKRMK
jgi:acyl carrier protein